MTLQSGSSLGRYRLLAPLGTGGMGEVWSALDERLKRRIAIKVLPPELAADAASLSRFQREAESLAALSHPHIVTIFSVEEADGFHFLTMEEVEGETLDDIIAAGPVDAERFFELAISLADAVAGAHARELIHRDLKPANVMVSGPDSHRPGLLKVLDFGLAKRATTAVSTQIETKPDVTRAGSIVGTAAYMSPEQVRGEAVDWRSDLFSLGSVLYELATGRPAFVGDDVSELLVAVLSREPGSVAASRPDLAGLDAILEGCFVKPVEERLQAASEVKSALRKLQRRSQHASGFSGNRAAMPPAAQTVATSQAGGARAASPERSSAVHSRPSLAVLPFRVQGSDPAAEALAEGLSVDVVDGIARASQMRVVPAGLAQRFHDTHDIQAAGRELGVRDVLVGRVRRSGPRVRVSAQLVAVESGEQFWARDHDVRLDDVDIFDLQDDIRDQLVSAISDIHGVIFERERHRLNGVPVEQLNPWECIYVTLGYDKFIDAEHHKLALAALLRAVKLSPDFALAWGYLSWIYTDAWLYGFDVTIKDGLHRAMLAARRGVELAPTGFMERWLLSRVHFFRGDYDAFVAEGEQSLKFGSSVSTTVGLVGMYMVFAGRSERGRELVARAQAMNPTAPPYLHLALAIDHYHRGEHEEALRFMRRGGVEGSFFFASLIPALLVRLGRHAEAADAWRDVLAVAPDVTEDVLAEALRRMNIRGGFLDSILQDLRTVGLVATGADPS